VGRETEISGFALSAEHYNRVLRHLEAETSVVLELDIGARLYTDDPLAHNTLAELPGRGKKSEIVMAGAHLDSWHGGTGATDNGAGSAVVLEAARILTTLGLRGERTIRFALWSGEERGLLGSTAYVADVFATRPTPVQAEEGDDLPTNYLDPVWPIEPKKAHEKFSAYFNLDNGTGRIRGVYAQENAAVVPIFNAWLEPFADLGAESVTMRNTGGTDHLSFDRVGLPGFQFVQDGMSYRTRTHHTNLDVYDHASEADLKQAAVIMASFLYHAATREELIPRKPMPREPEKKPEKKDDEG
jgi:Zn-dependent M28 family amino/carboxypeptidase